MFYPVVIALSFVMAMTLPPDMQPRNNTEFFLLGFLGLSIDAWLLAATVLTLSTMRRANGYRALHEFASGTHTYALRWPRLRRRQAVRIPMIAPEPARREGLPQRVGPFRVIGMLRESGADRTLLAEDASLGRRVWVWLRPGAGQDTSFRRDVGRATAFAFRGGISLNFFGVRVRRVSGGRPARWQYALRVLGLFGPSTVAISLAMILATAFPDLPPLWGVFWGLGVLLFVLQPILILVYPTRAPHDRLAGTVLVPS